VKTFNTKGDGTVTKQWAGARPARGHTPGHFLAAAPALHRRRTGCGHGTSAIEEVVVSGIRKSIEDSIDVKKVRFVDRRGGIRRGHRQDAGSSIAEAIGRLPGIAAQRTNGRAQTLSIRGLGPDFTVTTFNGREQASTNDNRSVEFDQYPSELVNQVKIYKTPDAGMAYQGIAGTTDIQTVHPLAYSDMKIAWATSAR
jgi:iron complex outermembrane receptor protein